MFPTWYLSPLDRFSCSKSGVLRPKMLWMQNAVPMLPTMQVPFAVLLVLQLCESVDINTCINRNYLSNIDLTTGNSRFTTDAVGFLKTNCCNASNQLHMAISSVRFSNLSITSSSKGAGFFLLGVASPCDSRSIPVFSH